MHTINYERRHNIVLKFQQGSLGSVSADLSQKQIQGKEMREPLKLPAE